MAHNEVLKARAASDDELEWIKYGRKLRQDSPDIIDAQAKALVALASTLLAVYTGALTLFKIPDNFNSAFFFLTGMGLEALISPLRLLIFTVPIILWLLSIKSSLDVYQPGAYKTNPISPNQINKTLDEIIATKYAELREAMNYFLVALAVSTLCIGIISLLTPAATVTPEPQEVQFIIPSSSTPVFDSMSIEWNKTNMTTASVKLLNESGNTINVQLENGRKVKFDRTLIQGIIYINSQPDKLNKTT